MSSEGNMSLPGVMKNPPMRAAATIIQIKKTLILSMRSWSAQVIVARQIVKA